MIAILEAHKSGLLHPKHWKTNIAAGVIVGVVALPLAMAFAIASGVKPEQGIYTAIIAGIIVGLFGGTRVQISGPTGAFVVILSAITAKYGINGLQIATIFAGGILLLMGFLKLGSVVKFIPYPVVVGFTSGIGVIILMGQWKSFFGLPVALPIDAVFYDKLILLLHDLPNLDPKTTLLSLLSLFLVIFTPRYIKSIPSPLIAMAVATLIQSYFDFSSIATIGSVFGGLPHTLPKFQLPDFSTVSLTNLLWPAFTIALLGAVESLLSASAADSIVGTKHSSNKELIGQGLANFITPFWGGFASTGAIARTVTNIRHGGNSPISAVVHSLVLVLTLLILAPYAMHIPFSVLAAILFVVAFNLCDVSEFMHIVMKAPWYDMCVLIITFILTVFTDLVTAVFLGVILSTLFFVLRTQQTRDIKMSSIGMLWKKFSESNIASTSLENGIIYNISGPMFFGAAEKIEHALSSTHTDPKCVVFRLQNVPFIDLTGLETLSKIVEQYHKRGVKVYFCEANKRVSKKLSRVGILKLVHTNEVFPSLEEVINFQNKSA